MSFLSPENLDHLLKNSVIPAPEIVSETESTQYKWFWSRFLPRPPPTTPLTPPETTDYFTVPPYTHSTVTMSSGGSCNVIVVDVSSFPYPSEIQEMPKWEVIVKCFVVAILILTAIVGNVLIIVIVSLSKKMRTTTNYYIVNLAIADLMVACFPMWIYVTTNVTDGWILGAFLCKFNALVQTSAMCAISFTMMAIAGDRFFAIVFPLKARVTQRKVKFIVVFVWICAISIGIPPLLYYTYTERQWANYMETFCSDVWPMVERSDGTCDKGKTAERVYWTVVVAVLNWIPMLMMTINYTVIIHRLQFSRVAHSGSDNMSAVQRRSARRVVIMLFTLLITFMICTLPFQVSTIFESYKDSQTRLPSWYKPVYFSAITLMYSHSTINPIVYGAMNQTFRNGFRHLLHSDNNGKRKQCCNGVCYLPVNALRSCMLAIGHLLTSIFRKFRNRKASNWESQMTVMESIRPNISVINDADMDPKIGTSITELVQSSSQLSLAMLKDGEKVDKA